MAEDPTAIGFISRVRVDHKNTNARFMVRQMHLYGPRPCRARPDGQKYDQVSPSGALVHARYPHTVVFLPPVTRQTQRAGVAPVRDSLAGLDG